MNQHDDLRNACLIIVGLSIALISLGYFRIESGLSLLGAALGMVFFSKGYMEFRFYVTAGPRVWYSCWWLTYSITALIISVIGTLAGGPDWYGYTLVVSMTIAVWLLPHQNRTIERIFFGAITCALLWAGRMLFNTTKSVDIWFLGLLLFSGIFFWSAVKLGIKKS